MGYTILLQWTLSNNPGRAPLTDIIATRVLEHYHIQYMTRMQISIRTFKHQSKTFSVIQYHPHTPGRKDPTGPPKDDTAYLFLDDRSTSDGSRKGKGKETERQEILGEAEDEEIQIIDPPPIPVKTSNDIKSNKRKRQYHTLAVKPAASVIPMFQNLLSPLVMGVTKSARQAASTTAQLATPTALSGTLTAVQSYHFPALASPHPPISLTVHSVPTHNTSTIILEAEYTDTDMGMATETDVTEAVLKEFLGDCIPERVGGEMKWWMWNEEEQVNDGWEGTEKSRKATQLLARCLRDSSII